MDYSMDVEMPKLVLALEDTSNVREHLKTHRDYRETVSGVGDTPASSGWMASLRESSILGLRLLEAQCQTKGMLPISWQQYVFKFVCLGILALIIIVCHECIGLGFWHLAEQLHRGHRQG